MNGPFKPEPPGFPPYLGSNWGGCDPIPDGNAVGPVLAPAIPWIDQYRVLKSPKPLYRKGKDFLLEPSPVQRGCRYYFDITVFAREKQFLREEAEQVFGGFSTVEEEIGAMNGARPSSQLKVLLQWFSARQEYRYMVADIGTGLDVSVGPTNAVRGFLLLPDGDAAPPVEDWPPGTAELENEVTATIVTAQGTMNRSGTSHIFNGRYTQTVLLPGGEIPAPAFVQVPAFARSVTIYPGGLGSVSADWVFDFTATSGTPVPLGTFTVPPSLDNYDVPQNAKFLALSNAGGGAASFSTVVFTLSF